MTLARLQLQRGTIAAVVMGLHYLEHMVSI
jgi:hypothetical protein